LRIISELLLRPLQLWKRPSKLG